MMTPLENILPVAYIKRRMRLNRLQSWQQVFPFPSYIIKKKRVKRSQLINQKRLSDSQFEKVFGPIYRR